MLTDPFGRRITSLRLSVTDRCDLRCHYCLGEAVQFVPKWQILSFEEIERLTDAFIGLGIRRVRLTGGEPLVRSGLVSLVARLTRHRAAGRLDEVTLTTNGTRLARHAEALRAAGLRRINVSLDSLSPETFRRITRVGRLETVLEGIAAARAVGLAVKINTLALPSLTEAEIDSLIAWCGTQGFALSLIEPMPLGETGPCRSPAARSLVELRREIARRWTLQPDDFRSGGPSRYVTVAETGGRLGFITPMTHGFCGACDRVRISATGHLFPCLGQAASVDLRPALRGGSEGALDLAIRAAIATKPQRHVFSPEFSGLARRMNVTGG